MLTPNLKFYSPKNWRVWRYKFWYWYGTKMGFLYTMHYTPEHPHKVVAVLFSADMQFRDFVAQTLDKALTMPVVTPTPKTKKKAKRRT